ncbi:MAG: hypothetical protein IPP97_05750 [Candidatus Obscuribacter sp.]|jgi:hypothetical protein|nr:hypothetical protein [Candidatus Obscuribacter sp.]MDQ5965757.1 hypothetical protein [Cyanobacteriota bacterium erpe_2018_sw_39hr_WHONDRS-SW48-000098_B_bin.30]MBK7838758.1 hypothetical protein [Candidatus Obscuribacter sp.]MBL0185211.1 hypothetical protein [Candidatus Obscuribacter sp.]MBP6350758.1 hypothetical protein [Candidatus Obscuribacter sp.]
MSNDLATTAATNTPAVVESVQSVQPLEASQFVDALQSDFSAPVDEATTQIVKQVPRISGVDVRRVVRDRKASEARNKTRQILTERLDAMNHVEHIQLALEAIVMEMTEKNPKAEYIAELLTYFLPEEKVEVAEALSTLIKEVDIKISFWRGELIFSRVCADSALSCEVRITSTNKVVMKSSFDLVQDDGQNQSLSASEKESADNHCCSVLDSFAFLNLCVHIWQALG